MKSKTLMKKFRLTLSEVSGSFGDLPTFLVFFIALVSINHIEPAPTLVFSGIFNVLNGILFNIPIPIEPMKAIGVLAISFGMSAQDICISGIIMGIILLILSLTNAMGKIIDVTPKPVVRGIQLALGIILIKQGLNLIVKSNAWFGINGYIVASLIFLFIFTFRKKKTMPIALLIFFMGSIFAVVDNYYDISSNLFKIYIPKFISLSSDNINSIIFVVTSQLPLTISNSVIATYLLICDYFPKQAGNISPKKIGFSLGMMNLTSCLFGGMPTCHGAGGVCAQYKFGARTGVSVIFLGILKIIAGLFFSGCIVMIAKNFSTALLSGMFLFIGLEMSKHSIDIKEKSDIVITILTALVSVLLNIPLGFTFGFVLSYTKKFIINRWYRFLELKFN